jgi:aminoglycoside phosphotransferase (APT) family kinase protein
LVGALLEHLEARGFEGSPRFLGYDEQGRHVVTYVEGEVSAAPTWQHDDAENADQLGKVARFLRALHDATSGFDPPAGMEPLRALPVAGVVWTHGDVGYQNLVYRGGRPTALIDWEFAAPAAATCDLAGLLALSVRAPRPDAEDNDRRSAAAAMACESIVSGYGLDDRSAAGLPLDAATVLDDAAEFWTTTGHDAQMISHARWRAEWFRNEFRP